MTTLAGAVFQAAGGDQGESRTEIGLSQAAIASLIAGMIYCRSRLMVKVVNSGSDTTSSTAWYIPTEKSQLSIWVRMMVEPMPSLPK